MRHISLCILLISLQAEAQTVRSADAQDTVVVLLKRNGIQNQAYRDKMAMRWQQNGYLLARADSLTPVSFRIIKGQKFSAVRLTRDGVSDTVLEASDLATYTEDWLEAAEDSGFPFARLKFSVVGQNDSLLVLKEESDRGVYHTTDTLDFGELRFHPALIRWCGGGETGDAYDHSRMNNLLDRLSHMEGVGCGTEPVLRVENEALKVYMPVYRTKRDYLSGIVGLATQPDGKPIFTGEISARFYNMFGMGAHAEFEWRSFRARSQEAGLSGSLPYLFGLPLVLKYSLNIEKLDTLFTNFGRGLELRFPIRRGQNLIAGVAATDRMRIYADRQTVELQRRLPDYPAARDSRYYLGFDFHNLREGELPVRNSGLEIRAGAGFRSLLRDAAFEDIRWLNAQGVSENIYDSLERTGRMRVSSYRVDGHAYQYLPLSRFLVLKTAVEAHYYRAPVVYFNELYRYGGIKNIRGFTEQSIFANEFAMATVELRFQSQGTGYIGPFYHAGWFYDRSGVTSPGHGWLHGMGISAALRTGAGVLQLAWAVGKSGAQPLALNQSRFHFGLGTQF